MPRVVAVGVVATLVAACSNSSHPSAGGSGPTPTASPRPVITDVGLDVIATTATTGALSDQPAQHPMLSGDGTRVVFASADPHLDPRGNVTSSFHPEFPSQVYVKDLSSGELIRASESVTGAANDDVAEHPTISADGQVVAFESASAALVPGVRQYGVFVKDLRTRRVTFAATSADGTVADAVAHHPSLSGDGRYVAFLSDADNLVPGDTNRVADAFVKDLSTGAITRLPLGPAGSGAQPDPDNADPTPAYPAARSGLITDLVLAADGRSVAFASSASNLVPGDDNHRTDVFVLDLTTGQLRNLTVSLRPAGRIGGSSCPALSADGSRVAFVFHPPKDESTGLHHRSVYVADTASGSAKALISTEGDRARKVELGCPALSDDAARLVLAHRVVEDGKGPEAGRTRCADVLDVPSGDLVTRLPCPMALEEAPTISGAGDRVAWIGGSVYPGDAGYDDVVVRRLR